MPEIYQLRGRIGRGRRKGYCYLLTKEHQTKKAKEREESIKNLGDSGGGFQLSLEDMRIRGAGEILGDKQHGALETFGYNLYIKMLNEEIQRIKGNAPEEEIEMEIKIDMPAFIPDDYIEKDEKIVIYRRAAELKTQEELKELESEVRDRFGNPPREVVNLFYYIGVKIKARELGISVIRQEKNGFFVRFLSEKVNIEKISQMMTMGNLKYLNREEGGFYRGNINRFFNEYEGVM